VFATHYKYGNSETMVAIKTRNTLHHQS